MLASLFIFLVAAEADNAGLQQPLQFSAAEIFFRVMASLLVILVLTYLVLKVVKKQQELQQKQQFRDRGWIRVLDYQALGTNRGLYLLEIINRVFIVGVSENQINIITEIDPSDESWNRLRENMEKPVRSEPLSWHKIVGEMIKKLGIVASPQEKAFQQELAEKLTLQVNDQMDRTHRLFRRVAKGGNDVEK